MRWNRVACDGRDAEALAALGRLVRSMEQSTLLPDQGDAAAFCRPGVIDSSNGEATAHTAFGMARGAFLNLSPSTCIKRRTTQNMNGKPPRGRGLLTKAGSTSS